jgi:hypothetical protein
MTKALYLMILHANWAQGLAVFFQSLTTDIVYSSALSSQQLLTVEIEDLLASCNYEN